MRNKIEVGYQVSLFDNDMNTEKENDSNLINIILWNIQNPSFERAKKQAKWILEIKPNILVLTEVKDSEGFQYIGRLLEYNGYTFIYNKSNSYFTAIAIKKISHIKKDIYLRQQSQRAVTIELNMHWGNVNLVGVYVPTNSIETEKIELKKEFQDNFICEIRKTYFSTKGSCNFIIGGDLNILEPNHNPRYKQFEKWNYFYKSFQDIGCVDIYKYLNPDKLEYTWERGNDRQRLDHVFLSKEIIKYVSECKYIHYPRLNKLSDHSAMQLVLYKN